MLGEADVEATEEGKGCGAWPLLVGDEAINRSTNAEMRASLQVDRRDEDVGGWSRLCRSRLHGSRPLTCSRFFAKWSHNLGYLSIYCPLSSYNELNSRPPKHPGTRSSPSALSTPLVSSHHLLVAEGRSSFLALTATKW